MSSDYGQIPTGTTSGVPSYGPPSENKRYTSIQGVLDALNQLSSPHDPQCGAVFDAAVRLINDHAHLIPDKPLSQDLVDKVVSIFSKQIGITHPEFEKNKMELHALLTTIVLRSATGIGPATLARTSQMVLQDLYKTPIAEPRDQQVASAARAQLFVGVLARLSKIDDPQEVVLAKFLVLFQNASQLGKFDAIKAQEYLHKSGMPQDEVKQVMARLRDPASSLSMLIDGASRLANGEEIEKLDSFKNLEGIKAVASECRAFTEVCERPLVKIYLETHSQNICQDIAWLGISTLHGRPRFAPIAALLNPGNAEKVPSEHHKVQWLADVEERPIPGEVVVIHSLVGTSKAGVNPSCFVSDHMGNVCFWKEARHVAGAHSEAGASHIASLITGGLVPVAVVQSRGEPSVPGVIQPYVHMKKGPFAPKNYEEGTFDPAKLNRVQKEQLFVHMIADRVISNYDTHTGQFRLDAEGNIIGYDKGQSFKFFEQRGAKSMMGRAEPSTFDPSYYWPPFAKDRPTYSVFANYLQEHPEEAREIFQSDTVQSALDRAEKIPLETVHEALHPLATMAFKGGEDEFISKVHERCKSIRNEVREYFLGSE